MKIFFINLLTLVWLRPLHLNHKKKGVENMKNIKTLLTRFVDYLSPSDEYQKIVTEYYAHTNYFWFPIY